MKQMVPLEKQSKKARQEFHRRQRGSWGEISPITRTSPNPRAYKRKKIRKGDADERPDTDFFYPLQSGIILLKFCVVCL